MIDREHELPVTAGGTVGHCPSAPTTSRARCRADLVLMRRLDELHLEFPFAGTRMLRGLLLRGIRVGRRHVGTLMRRMGMRRSIASRQHQAGTRPQDLSLSAARPGDHSAKPGLGNGYHLQYAQPT